MGDTSLRKKPSTWFTYVRYIFNGYRECCINRSVAPREVNAYYNRSKICLNIHHEQSQEGCNPRFFEIMGTGGFQLVDDNSYVRDKIGSTLIRYSDYEDLKSKITYSPYSTQKSGRRAQSRL